MSSEICGNTSLADWQCLVSSGYNFAIIQTFQGGYQYNNMIADCVNWAWSAGMSHVDVYVFMCPNCVGNNPPANVVSAIVNNLKSAGVQYGMLWFDIEQCDGCWFDPTTNFNFIQQAVQQAASMGVNVGIYSSDYEWNATVGGSTGLQNYPLWYADWDGQENFNDQGYLFGGWSAPAIKQFADSGPCVNVDLNWYPDGIVDDKLPSSMRKKKRPLSNPGIPFQKN